MTERQIVEEIPLALLLERVQLMHARGRRLAQICCTRLAGDHEVNYSFDRDPRRPAAAGSARAGTEGAASAAEPDFHTLRVRIPLVGGELPSISSFYWSAFLYENEIHDLFGVTVLGMAVDFHGSLYKTMEPAPYVPKSADAPLKDA
jgi:ech hydrogenase subunit D